MINQMNNINHVNYTFFDAYDNNYECVINDYNKINKIHNNFKFKIGEIGLIHSTINLFEKINKTNIDYVIILEDDVFLHKDFVNLFKFYMDNKVNIDFKYIGYNQYNKNIINSIHYSKDNNININSIKRTNNSFFYGTYSYICNRRFRNYIINLGISFFLNNKYTIDFGYNIIRLRSNMKFYIFGGEQLIIPDIYDDSCINNDRENKNNSWYTHKNIKLNKYYNFNIKQLKFVFIIPSFNNEKWIKKNLESIFNQKNYTNWHIIYINDNSNDKTDHLFHTLKEPYEKNITYIKNNNTQGQALNRYKAYNMCYDNDFCIMLDGDDWLYTNYALSYLNYFIQNNDIDITYGNYYIYENNNVSKDNITFKDFDINTIKNKLYRKHTWISRHLRVVKAKYLKMIDKNNIIDFNGEYIKCSTDLVEMFESLEKCNSRHKILSQPISVYNKDNSKLYQTSYYNDNDEMKLYRTTLNNIIINKTL